MRRGPIRAGTGEPHGAWLGRALRGAAARASIPYVIIGLLLAAAIVLVGDDLWRHLAQVEAWIQSIRPWSEVAFMALFIVFTSVLLPGSMLSLMAGALFGFAWGFVAVIGASLMAAAVQYALARQLLRTPIQRRLAARPSLAAIQRAVLRDEFRLQVLLRLTPVNPATVSYVLGAAGVRFRGFMVACLGLTPHLTLEVWIGYAGKHLAALTGAADGRAAQLHDVMMAAGLILAVVVMVVLTRRARRAFLEASAAEGASDGADGSDRRG